MDPVADNSVDHLWRLLKETGDRDARDQLILQFSPLVKFVAGRIRSGLPAGVDQNDLPFRSTFPYVAMPHDGFGGLAKRTEPAHAPVPQPPA